MNLYWPCKTWRPLIFDRTVLSFWLALWSPHLLHRIPLSAHPAQPPEAAPSDAPGAPLTLHTPRHLSTTAAITTAHTARGDCSERINQGKAAAGCCLQSRAEVTGVACVLIPPGPQCVPWSHHSSDHKAHTQQNCREIWRESISSVKWLSVVIPMWCCFSRVKQYRRGYGHLLKHKQIYLLKF